MFDPKKTFNRLPQLPPKYDFDDIDILKAVNKANKELAALDSLLLSLPNPNILTIPFSVKEAVASSQIENINTTVAEVFQAQILPEAESTGPQKETLHYKEALLEGLRILKSKNFLNTNSFLEIQAILEPNKKGIRKLPGTSIKNTISGEIIYTPPEGEDRIRRLLKNFDAYYNSKNEEDDIDPLIKMAILHYQFEAIHPFYDGNGRTGRILMVLYLVLAKLLDSPVLYISGYINKNRSEYYKHLSKVTADRDWKSWVLFVLNAVRYQAITTQSSVYKLKILQKKIETILEQNLTGNFREKFVNYIISKPFYTQSDCSKTLRMNRLTAKKYLEILTKKGILEVIEYKKYRIYFNKELLDILS